jgi:epoxyqueuosine reductase
MHGGMGWMEARADQRADPRALWPEARSVIALGLSYAPGTDPLESLAWRDRATISVYARNRDYHDVVKKRLKALARWMVTEYADAGVKVFVDTAPVMEKPLAQQAGLGWQGKHTNLVSREFGSWLFLGSIFTTLDLPADPALGDHCGSCQACLDICPTQAFPAPYRLDARRCISYLTIEYKGHIDRDLRPFMGNRIYGCDDCLAVCPWNKFSQTSHEMKLAARADLVRPDLAALVVMDDASFRQTFAGGPIKRIGHARFIRNVLIAIGNSGDPQFRPLVQARLEHAEPLIRAMAIWALARLISDQEFAALAVEHSEREEDEAVREEWRSARMRTLSNQDGAR